MSNWSQIRATHDTTCLDRSGYDGFYELLAAFAHRAIADLWLPVGFSIDPQGRFCFTGDYEKDFISAVETIMESGPMRNRLGTGPGSAVRCATRARNRIKARIQLGFAKHGLEYIRELHKQKLLVIIYSCKGWVQYIARPTKQKRNHKKITGVKMRRRRTEGARLHGLRTTRQQRIVI